MPNTTPRPTTVKIAIFIFGILAFKSWLDVSTKNSESVEVLLPLALAVPLNITFIALISDAKFGRVLAIIISIPLAILIAGYWLVLSLSSNATQLHFFATTTTLLLFLAWLLAYSFGKNTRAYYSHAPNNKASQHP